jgi:hypothetical protein
MDWALDGASDDLNPREDFGRVLQQGRDEEGLVHHEAAHGISRKWWGPRAAILVP